MQFAEFNEILITKAGFDPKAIGLAAIKAAALKRIEITGCTDDESYIRKLQTDADELEAFVLALTVPETWFFREKESFAFLRHYLETNWLPAHKGRKLHILSIPCCTGEEPYSIAMTLQDIGMPKDSFSIDAFDINPDFLAKARAAEYTMNSFRGTAPLLRSTYFTETGDRFRLARGVAQTVHFDKGNILAMQFHPFKEKYPIVFCRNLLIYMHPKAQQQALSALDNCIEPDGLLFVGHAEAVSLPAYKPVSHQFAFAYHKTTGHAPESSAVPAAVIAAHKKYSPAKSTFPTDRNPLARESGTHGPVLRGRTASKAGCWGKIGIDGDRSCEKLKEVVNCRNCELFIKAGRALFDRTPPVGYREEWTELLAAKEPPRAAHEISLLIFRAGADWFALPSKLLRRISGRRPVHSIPHSATELRGIVNVDGELHLCFDLRRLLAVSAGEYAEHNGKKFPRTVIVSLGGKDWAVEADEVLKIAMLDTASIKPPEPSHAGEQHAKGFFDAEGKRVLLLDEELLAGSLRRSLK